RSASTVPWAHGPSTSGRPSGSTVSRSAGWPRPHPLPDEPELLRKDPSWMSRYLRPNIARMAGYVPGEQPRHGGVPQLDTNENPSPPSPRVQAALIEAVTDRLRLYPDPLATELRQTAAQLHGVQPEMILAGNGSDDLLTIITRACLGSGDTAAFASPS